MLELIFIEGGNRGKSIQLTFEKAWFGRQPTCDFVLQGEGVSRVHFSVMRHGEDYVLLDNKSTNGTLVNGVKVTAVTLRPGYQIAAGNNVLQVREADEASNLAFRFVAEWKNSERGAQVIERRTILLGRKNVCQIQLNDPAVSPVHAELERHPDGLWITDESSAAGVYVNGVRVVKQRLRHGDCISIRPFEINVRLSDEACILEVQEPVEESRAPANLPEKYQAAVAAARPSGEAKPSAAIAGPPVWMQAKAPIWVPTSDILPNRFRSGLIVLWLLAALATGVYAWATKDRSFFSPAPLAKYHSAATPQFQQNLHDLRASECSACHAGFARVPDANCRACHKESQPIEVHRGHGVACSACHAEHRGTGFAAAREVGGACQAAGCHVRPHQKPELIEASHRRMVPTPVSPAVSFEANFAFGADADVHPQHKVVKMKCLDCHDDEEAEKKVPRAVMRMRCLNCHGFGPEATLRERCYSCHFEHPTETPEKVLAALSFKETKATSVELSANSRQGIVVVLGALLAVPLFYFGGSAFRFRLEHQSFRERAAAGVRASQGAPRAAPVQVAPIMGASVAALASGRAEPKPTDNQAQGGHLRPQIDLDLCVGCGTCVHVCPFNVLEIINEKAIAARLEDCTGYAACVAECPTEAIRMVTGGAMQTVDLPVYNTSLETNVPGLYLAGEVTGKALIKIAINQGKTVVDSILRQRPEPGLPYDVIVIGAGPAGTSCALAALSEGLKVLVLEQGTVGNTIRSYPRQKFVMAEPVMIPLYGPLEMQASSKEKLLERWEQIIAKTGLKINEEEKVLRVEKRSGHFLVQSTKGEYKGARVVMAIGRRGSPRKLGVRGEDSAKVAYNLLDAEAYRGKALCVVGGGDSGIEAANGLARADLENRVWLVHRGPDFSRAKPRNQKKIKKAVEEGRLGVFYNAGVIEIRPSSAVVQTASGNVEIPNDFMFVMVGGENPKKFLTECGIEFSNRAL